MDQLDLVNVSLDVKAAFFNTPCPLLEAVSKRLCLLFCGFKSKYIRTRR